MRAYCDFYEVAPTDDALLATSRALIADPDRDGVQLLARAGAGPLAPPLGFATVFWSWTTTGGGRLGVMNDLYVAPAARGSGVADALIAACHDEARSHGAVRLAWTTAPDNLRAQAVYGRVGATRSEWVHYTLGVEAASASSSSAHPEK